MAASANVLIFDSGLGGLTVFREVAAARPDASYTYIADDAAFPYGALPEPALIDRVTNVLGAAISAHKPDLVVVACNTASTLALSHLRSRFRVPFVGTVPAIKPACAQSSTKRVAVLGTQATVGREYTRALIREFAGDCDVILVGAQNLATHAESELAGSPVVDTALETEIAACFVDQDGKRTDTIVLACTHYPLLIDRLRELAPWPVTWLDPAPAIARRVVDLIGASNAAKPPAPPRFIFTSGRTPTPALASALASFGFTAGRAGI